MLTLPHQTSSATFGSSMMRLSAGCGRSSSDVIAGLDLGDRPRKSRWPARMDVAQSLSGLVLALFMWGHMFFVASILVSKDFMWTVTKMFEGYFIFGKAYPGIVSVLVAVISR
jgi:hypothetical protein